MAQATASENETPQSAISLVVYHLDADPTLEGGKHIATALTDAIGEMAYHHPDVLWTYLEGMVKFYQPPYPVEAFDPRTQEGLNLLKRWGIAYAVTGQIQGGPQGTLQLSLYQPPETRPVWQQSYPVTSSGDLEPALQNLLTALFERIGKPLTDSNRRFLARRWYRTSQGQQAYGQGMACHWRENDPEECRKAFMTAIKAEPEVADGYDYLGWSLVREGDWAQAAQSFQHATELQPGFFDALWGLHISLRQQGNFKAAREVLETVQHTHGGQWEVLSYNLMQPGAFADDLADSRQRLRRQAGQSAYWQDRYLDAEIQSLFLAGEWRELIERYQERLALLKSMLGEQHPATLAWAKKVQRLQIAYQSLAQQRQTTTLLEITTPSGKRIQDFILPLAVAREYQPLVAMLLQDPSMDDEQRQEMINKLPLLEPAKREKLAHLQQARPRLSWYEQWLQGKTDHLYALPEIQPVAIEKLTNTGVQIGSLEWLLRSIDLSSQAAQAREAGDYAKAETLARQSLILAEDFGGPEHLPDGENFAEYLDFTLSILGKTLEDQQRYAEAEPAYRRLLAVRNGYLGSEHPDTALGMNSLARLLRKQGKYTEAEEFCRHALAIYEKVQGPEHLDTAFGLNNLALVLDDQGRYVEAEGLYRRVLVITEKEKGPDHPDTATSLNNLASAIEEQGRYAEAESLRRRALKIVEQSRGENHPDTADILSNLAALLGKQGRYAEAETLQRRALTILEQTLPPENPDIALSLDNLGGILEARGRYAEAETLLRRALTIREKVLGPDHPDVANSLNNLAAVLGDQGRYSAAESMFRHALAIREKVLGPDHPDVANSLNNLADILEKQSRYAEAESLLRRALAIREKRLGPDHPDVATGLGNLAELLKTMGRYTEAEPLQRRALAIREKRLGPEHPDVALSLNNLAGLLIIQGHYAEAESLRRRALAMAEKALGTEHPATVRYLNNLASLLNDQGHHTEAENLYHRVLTIRQKTLGPDHPETALVLNNLGYTLMAQGRYAEAETLISEALAIAEKSLGQDHPQVATSLNNLAGVMDKQGRYAETEARFRRVLEIRERTLGRDHLETAASLSNLALWFNSQGRYAEAEPLLRRVLEIREQVLGAEHPETADSLTNLASLLHSRGRYAEAEGLHRRALAIYEKTLGLEHPNTAHSLNSLATLLDTLGQYEEAESLTRRVLEIREKTLGPEHPATALALNNLAAILDTKKEYSKSEELYRRALAIREKMLGPEHPDIATTLENLAVLLSEQDRLNEIEPLQRRALAIREKVLGPEHPDTARSSAGLGWVLAKQGHYDEAEPIYRRAIAIVRKVDESLIQLTLDAQLGALLFEKQGKPLEALPYYREAADVLDRLFAYTRSEKLPEEARYTFLEQYAYVYPALIGLLLQLHEQDPKAGYDREVLAVASRNQSRIFSELLRQADVKTFAADPTFVDLKNRRELLEQRLSLLREKYATVPISAANADSQRAAFSEQIKQAESELQALEQRLWKDYPRFMELVQPRTVTVDDLQKRLLRPGEALLGVVVLPKRTVVLVVTPERFLLHPVDLSEQNLADRSRQIRQSLEQPGQQVNTDLLAKLDPVILYDLYQHLFPAPVEESLKGAKQVLVVAAGPLYSLPLELLVTTYGETEQKAFKKAKARAYGSSPEQAILSEYATLSYLGDRYRFSYLPSLSALVSQRDYPKKPVPIQRELIAFADPIFGAEGPATPAEPAATYSPATQATLRGLDRSGANPTLNRLPHTADEVNDIAHLFTDQPAPYLRDAAQEHTAKDLAKAGTLQGLRYLIFATHGLLGGEFLQVKTALETQPLLIPDRLPPMLPKEERAQPALALTLIGNRLQGEDGFLTLQEVLDELPLNTDLVVLSACNTAGDPQRSNQGEGFAGLTRAFLFAGARHLLVSHWYVASDSTRDLMVATFTQLQAGQPPLDALTEARRQVRGRTWQPQATAPYVSLAHPYFWAPFVVVGD